VGRHSIRASQLPASRGCDAARPCVGHVMDPVLARGAVGGLIAEDAGLTPAVAGMLASGLAMMLHMFLNRALHRMHKVSLQSRVVAGLRQSTREAIARLWTRRTDVRWRQQWLISPRCRERVTPRGTGAWRRRPRVRPAASCQWPDAHSLLMCMRGNQDGAAITPVAIGLRVTLAESASQTAG